MAPTAVAGDGGTTIVTLSSGTTSSIVDASASGLGQSPLAVTWAPQLLVRGDANKDEQLGSAEFAAQLQRAGVAADQAQKLLALFDSSSDGKLSVDEFAKAAKASVARGETLFASLVDSYVRDIAGTLDPGALGGFLDKGHALALEYA